MTNEQKKAGKEYMTLKDSGLGLGEVHTALVNMEVLICRRMRIIYDLLGRTDNDSNDELKEFARFRGYALRLRERLQMMFALCENDADEYIMLMDTSADRIIRGGGEDGQKVPSKGNKSTE